MLKKVGIFLSFILFICGINIIGKWNANRQLYIEGNTLEEISADKLWDVNYVSFYIEDYANKEVYTDKDTEYEIYTVLAEHDTTNNVNWYIQVMIKEQETKDKLKNSKQEKVYIQGQVLCDVYDGCKISKEWENGVPAGMDMDSDKLVANLVVMEQEIPDIGYDWVRGIVIVIVAIILYRAIGGIEACVPTVVIGPSKFTEYNYKYAMQTNNMENELINEKENLKRLQKEQVENNKVCNIMIIMIIVGVILFLGDITMLSGSILYVVGIMLKIFAGIMIYVGIGGLWPKFINSSHKLAIYIAKKRGKRSIYVAIEECKKNIEVIERILEDRNREEINRIVEGENV